MIERIPMSLPEIDESDIAAVVEVLRSGRLSRGAKTEEFEEGIRKYIGVQHAVAVSSGNAALHLIVKALVLGPGDEVLVPSFTFSKLSTDANGPTAEVNVFDSELCCLA